MINKSLFTAQSGDYSVITQAITSDDALTFGEIYNELNDHAISSEDTLFNYLNQGVCIAMQNKSIAAIATLKAVGLIQTTDNIHIGLSFLGYGFYQFIQVDEVMIT